jgi:hypothetical protein
MHSDARNFEFDETGYAHLNRVETEVRAGSYSTFQYATLVMQRDIAGLTEDRTIADVEATRYGSIRIRLNRDDLRRLAEDILDGLAANPPREYAGVRSRGHGNLGR